jgi:hypothetical protein
MADKAKKRGYPSATGKKKVPSPLRGEAKKSCGAFYGNYSSNCRLCKELTSFTVWNSL